MEKNRFIRITIHLLVQILRIKKEDNHSFHTRHDLKAIETLALENGDGFVRLLLLLGAPILDLVQDIDPGRILRPNFEILVLTENSSVHCREIDGRDGEGAVHVQNDSPEASFGSGRDGESGHGNWGFEFGA